MIYVFAIIAGIVGAAVGWAGFAFATILLGGHFGMTDFEGARAMTAIFGIGPIGGLIGLIVGIWLVLRLGRHRSGLVMMGRGLVVVIAIVALGAGVLGYLYLSDDVLNRDGPTPVVEFEIRFPPGAAAPARDAIRITLDTDKNQADAFLHTDWLLQDGGRNVLSGGVQIYFRTSQRILVLKIKDQPDRLFMLKLASNPDHSDEFGPWRPVDFAAEGEQTRPPKPDEQFDIRYRVDRGE